MSLLWLISGPGGETQPLPLPWWFWAVLFLLLALILWWLWYQGRRNAPTATVATKAVSAPPAADDLKIVEGIGPKINAVLQAAGVHTFADLASAVPESLKETLLKAGMRLADPSTWPQQAALARDGKLDELKALQDRLTAGRK